jgi:hypothetical protein
MLTILFNKYKLILINLLQLLWISQLEYTKILVIIQHYQV